MGHTKAFKNVNLFIINIKRFSEEKSQVISLRQNRGLIKCRIIEVYLSINTYEAPIHI